MGQYRARDALLVPSWISFTRLPLAILFPATIEQPLLALGILLLAGLTDVVDGWYARRFGQVTPTGAVIDGITDKAFMVSVLITLLWNGHLSVSGALLLGARDLGELPLVLWWSFSRPRRRAKVDEAKANLGGKLATLAQFISVTLLLFQRPEASLALVVTGAIGIVAALAYWRRELRSRKLDTAPLERREER